MLSIFQGPFVWIFLVIICKRISSDILDVNSLYKNNSLFLVFNKKKSYNKNSTKGILGRSLIYILSHDNLKIIYNFFMEDMCFCHKLAKEC